MVFHNNGVTSFDAQYWDGSSWKTIPGGSVRSNNKVLRKLTFPGVTTDKIRLVVNAAAGANSRVVQLEAYGVPVASRSDLKGVPVAPEAYLSRPSYRVSDPYPADMPTPSPTPTPVPTPAPSGSTLGDLAALGVFFDANNNVGFGTPNPVFNDDGATGGRKLARFGLFAPKTV
jgi:hypothetical protein